MKVKFNKETKRVASISAAISMGLLTGALIFLSGNSAPIQGSMIDIESTIIADKADTADTSSSNAVDKSSSKVEDSSSKAKEESSKSDKQEKSNNSSDEKAKEKTESTNTDSSSTAEIITENIQIDGCTSEDNTVEVYEEQYSQPEETPTTNSAYYGNYSLSDNDMFMMCAVVSSETGYCEDQAQKAVAHTILNRLSNDNFPNDMYSVLTQENQYTAIDCYFTGNYRPGLEPGSDGWNHTMQICYEALNEYDFTNGAVAYYNPEICGYNAWFESLTLTYVDQYGRFFTW